MSGWWRRSRLVPWAGLLLGGLAWGVDHQLGSQSSSWACEVQGAGTSLAIGLSCAAVIVIATWLAWGARDSEVGYGRVETRRFGALISLLAGGLFLLAVIFQTAGAVILPPCLR